MNAENKIMRWDSDTEIIILANICARIVINVCRNVIDANDKINYYLSDAIKGNKRRRRKREESITCHIIRKKILPNVKLETHNGKKEKKKGLETS